eukprot:scaffold17957_cov76-Amphora_coffeaeformis.AAC.1
MSRHHLPRLASNNVHPGNAISHCVGIFCFGRNGRLVQGRYWLFIRQSHPGMSRHHMLRFASNNVHPGNAFCFDRNGGL